MKTPRRVRLAAAAVATTALVVPLLAQQPPRSRAITRKLQKVEELPSNPEPLLKNLLGDDAEGD